MELSNAQVSTVTVLYAFTMLAAIVGNSLLVYIVWKKPEVRSLTSSMFVNMAIADLLHSNMFVAVVAIVLTWTVSQFSLSLVTVSEVFRERPTFQSRFQCGELSKGRSSSSYPANITQPLYRPYNCFIENCKIYIETYERDCQSVETCRFVWNC